MFSCFGVWSLVVLLLCSKIGVCLAQNDSGPDMITWDDLLLTQSKAEDNGEEEARVIVVNPKGGGDAQTVSDAIKMVPEHNEQRVKIHVLPGTYEEKVFIPASKPYISLIGDPENPKQAVITGHAKESDPNESGGTIGTFGSATVTIEADYFCASGITFENTAGPGSPALALIASGNKMVFYKARFTGSQDSLLDSQGSHYFFKCFIEGATDFIAGNGRSLYEECIISVISPGSAIAAQKRDIDGEDTGFSFVKCTVTGNGTNLYLGRAWGKYSRVIYSLCNLDIDINSEGWYNWGDESREQTVVFGEYQNSGRGTVTGRVPWSKTLSSADAQPYLGKSFISGQDWLKLSS